MKIDTCYHWLQQDQLDAKLDYAKENSGKFRFFGDEVVYCWRSPLGAYSGWEDHGDKLIRIKFKPEAVVQMIKHERTRTASGNRALGAAVIYSNDNEWQEYTIAPEAVESWSAFQPETVREMKAEMAFYISGKVTENDVFYPFTAFKLNQLQHELIPIIKDHEEKSKHIAVIYGEHPEHHFSTSVAIPWRAFIEDTKAQTAIFQNHEIKIVVASFGANLDSLFNGNATEAAAKFCNGKLECDYKISPAFINDTAPDKDKDFEISWSCGEDPKVNHLAAAAPANDKHLLLKCN